MSATTDHYRYWAFVSYSSKDTGVARKLHRRLETYRIPRDLVGRPGRDGPVPRRLFPIFRDREELPLSSDLGASIEDALRASRYLIVLCSPRSATSRWVNEEIRYFKSLGRDNRILAIILDGEPNASDVPGAEDQECFSPALRFRVDSEGQLTDERTEPIAGDLRPQGDGWSGAFLKAVAGITGLGFDAFARRERKRQRRRRLAGGAVGILLIAAGLWAWDYNRLKVDHYANVATRWGVPEGVGRLDAQTRAGRETHYRFESRRYKVRQVLRVNSVGTLRNDEENHGASVQQIFYREDGSIQQINLRDHNDRLVMRQTSGEFRDTPEGRVDVVKFGSELGSALALEASVAALEIGATPDDSRTEITAHEVLYDDLGRPLRVTFQNPFGANRANADGVFAQRFEYEGGAPLPSRMENLGFDGEPQASRSGVASLTITRNSLGDRAELTHFGPGGSPALHPNGYHRAVRTLDAHGNLVDVVFLAPNGSPVLHRDGYHRLTQAFDERGNVTEWAYFGMDGEPALHRAGYHRLTRVFDERGNVTALAYFGLDGEPALHRDGYHRFTRVFDERGNVTEWADFGMDGEPTVNRDGYHRLMRVFDERGILTEWAYFGVDGEPTLHRDGHHRLTQAFDERGNVTEWAYFGMDGEPALYRDGHHRLTRVFDDWGNVTEQTYFGADGEPGLHQDVHSFRQVVDERGNVTEQAYFGVDGEPTLHRDGYHRFTRVFDERGNVTEWADFGMDGEPTVNREGYHRLTRVFDERGNVTEQAYFGADGEPGLHQDVHSFSQVVDERGNVTEQAFFGVGGEPTLHRDGYHRLTQAFDERGNVTAVAYFGIDGRAVPVSGFVRLEIRYDAHSQETSMVGYRADGTSVRLQ